MLVSQAWRVSLRTPLTLLSPGDEHESLQMAKYGAPQGVVELVGAPEPEAPKADEALVAVEYAPSPGKARALFAFTEGVLTQAH